MVKKLFIKYSDGSETVYDMRNKANHMEYVNRHIDSADVESIILQQYPKKYWNPLIIK